MRGVLGATLLGATLLGALATPARAQFCPSYSSASASNPNDCGVPSKPGTQPSVTDWRGIIERACAGPSGPDWNGGPAIGTIGRGCTGAPVQVTPTFPCELVEAIAMQETRWVQFCPPTEPSDQVGLSARTIVSFDCGYGVAQVTSGMHEGETPDFDRARVAGEALYALEVGLKILAEKWRATACVGDNQPTIVEDWYLATWAYNGLSFQNNPNNPNLDAMRPPCDPNVSCAGRPYQERVWGWMAHPPADARWAALQPAYPDSDEIPTTSGTPIPKLSEPRCEGPTTCTGARAVHTSRCAGGTALDLGADGAIDGDGGSTIPDGGGTPGDDAGCACDVGAGVRGSAHGVALLLCAVVPWLRRRRR